MCWVGRLPFPAGSTGSPEPRPLVRRFPSFRASCPEGIRPRFRSPHRTAKGTHRIATLPTVVLAARKQG